MGERITIVVSDASDREEIIMENVELTPYWIDGLCIPIPDIYMPAEYRERDEEMVDFATYNEWRMFSD